MIISDDKAVAQTIILNAGKGIVFSQKIMDMLKKLMCRLKIHELQAGGYLAVREGNKVKIQKMESVSFISQGGGHENLM